MIAKLGSGLGSPKLSATTAHLRNRIPAQMRRLIPLYVACVILVLFILNLRLVRSGKQHSVQFPRPAFTGQQIAKTRSIFPKKIWQTWKVNPLDFEERDVERARSWLERNPEHRYEVLTDDNEIPYVEYHFGPEGFNRPDIVNFYKTIKATIVKADLLRYMIMYAEGGLYADIDVEALRPLSRFIPDRYDESDIDMIIGVEIDEPDWKNHPILGPKSMSFCQWVFMCKPQLPVMMRLIEQIMAWLTAVAKKQGKSIADVELDFDEIISGTGPSAFTNAILKDMNEHRSTTKEITWDQFHDLTESKIVSRVLVLTVEAFAAGQGHSDSGTHGARAALVKHHYHASHWPDKHPRFKHPVYGEVENCNWNDECVNKWDTNVAAFEKMSKDEQQKLIEETERERKAEEERKEAEEKKQKEEAEAERKKEEEAKKEEAEKKKTEEVKLKEEPKQ
jgi:mannosyltransferase OCH1-like enzyme